MQACRGRDGRLRVDGRVHTVRLGECLSVIAERYGMHWPEIARRNGVLGPSFVIQPGQLLKLG